MVEINQGDGSMERRLSQQRCPRCYSLLTYVSDDGHKTKYDCLVCHLKVVDVKGESE